MITKGAFSHETNPIDIMQDGAKVGEMTERSHPKPEAKESGKAITVLPQADA